MINEHVKEIALANSFKIKEQPDGTMDLNPYVYEFARALLDDEWLKILKSGAAKTRSSYRDGDWFESCKSDDHDD